jgi:predicted  nucleic acid-binding Zn-ribbon protein
VGGAAAPDADSEESLRTAAVQTQISALRADMQKLQDRMAALQTQVATAMAEAPEINARINAALTRLAAAQKKGGPV